MPWPGRDAGGEEAPGSIPTPSPPCVCVQSTQCMGEGGGEEVTAGLMERRAGGTPAQTRRMDRLSGQHDSSFSPRPRRPHHLRFFLLPVTPIPSASTYLSPRKTCFPGSHANCVPPRPRPSRAPRPRGAPPRERIRDPVAPPGGHYGKRAPLRLAPLPNPAPQGGSCPGSCRVSEGLLLRD